VRSDEIAGRRDHGDGQPVNGGEDSFGRPATYLISEELGQRSGSNLFHSFLQFDVGTGEVATFTGSPEIANIVARVLEGGPPSRIEGAIRTTIDGANLFFLNPSGSSSASMPRSTCSARSSRAPRTVSSSRMSSTRRCPRT
jgi:filamentous hemagglutinin family protein